MIVIWQHVKTLPLTASLRQMKMNIVPIPPEIETLISQIELFLMIWADWLCCNIQIMKMVSVKEKIILTLP